MAERRRPGEPVDVPPSPPRRPVLPSTGHTPEFCDGQLLRTPGRPADGLPQRGPVLALRHVRGSRPPDGRRPADGLRERRRPAPGADPGHADVRDPSTTTGRSGASSSAPRPRARQVEISRRPVALVLADANFRVLGSGLPEVREQRVRKHHRLGAEDQRRRLPGGEQRLHPECRARPDLLRARSRAPWPGQNVFAVNGYTALGGNGSSRNGPSQRPAGRTQHLLRQQRRAVRHQLLDHRAGPLP